MSKTKQKTESSTLSKGNLVALIAEKSGQTKKDTEIFLNNFLDTVTSEVAKGNKIQLIGFGTFEVRERQEREGRNPQTGEKMLIPASKAPAFKAGKQFKELCN